MRVNGKIRIHIEIVNLCNELVFRSFSVNQLWRCVTFEHLWFENKSRCRNSVTLEQLHRQPQNQSIGKLLHFHFISIFCLSNQGVCVCKSSVMLDRQSALGEISRRPIKDFHNVEVNKNKQKQCSPVRCQHLHQSAMMSSFHRSGDLVWWCMWSVYPLRRYRPPSGRCGKCYQCNRPFHCSEHSSTQNESSNQLWCHTECVEHIFITENKDSAAVFFDFFQLFVPIRTIWRHLTEFYTRSMDMWIDTNAIPFTRWMAKR